MRATQNCRPIPPNVSIPVETGDILNIQGATAGTYGYLNVGGGFDVPEILGARGAHLRAGLGVAIQTGDRLPIGDDPHDDTMQTLTPEPRLAGGALRAVHSIQTNRFSPSDLSRFQATAFRRDPRANRMGLRLDYDGAPFTAADQLNVLSEIIVPGDIQMTGDGTPYILMPECQTTGGYPRIGTIIPSDLPRAAQAPVGAPLTIQFIALTEATEIERRTARELAHLAGTLRPLVRDPHDIPDLLSYQLIDGVISGKRSK
jgi:allophanate hydrolase